MLLWFPHCHTPTKLPLMMVTISPGLHKLSEVLEAMVPVLLAVAVAPCWSTASDKRRCAFQAGLRPCSPSSSPLRACCRDDTMPTRHPRHAARPVAGRSGSVLRSSAHEGSALKGSLSPVTNVTAVRDPVGGGYL